MPALAVALALFGVAVVMRWAGIRNGVAYFVVALASVGRDGRVRRPSRRSPASRSACSPPRTRRERADLDRVNMLWRRFREQPIARSARIDRRGAAPGGLAERAAAAPDRPVDEPADRAAVRAGQRRDLTRSPRCWNGPRRRRSRSGSSSGSSSASWSGITTATWLGSRRWLGRFPLTVAWPPLFGAATVAGIGFTVALLIAELSFTGDRLEEAKLGILGASILAAALSVDRVQADHPAPARTRSRTAPGSPPPLIDLADPVDPDRDHVRGSEDAPVTLVEYADFECPYCGQAEPSCASSCRRTARIFATCSVTSRSSTCTSTRSSRRKRPRSPASAGKFWEMHDRLFAGSDALGMPTSSATRRDRAGPDRFARDLDARHYSLRVARDVESADRAASPGRRPSS